MAPPKVSEWSGRNPYKLCTASTQRPRPTHPTHHSWRLLSRAQQAEEAMSPNHSTDGDRNGFVAQVMQSAWTLSPCRSSGADHSQRALSPRGATPRRKLWGDLQVVQIGISQWFDTVLSQRSPSFRTRILRFALSVHGRGVGSISADPFFKLHAFHAPRQHTALYMTIVRSRFGCLLLIWLRTLRRC